MALAGVLLGMLIAGCGGEFIGGVSSVLLFEVLVVHGDDLDAVAATEVYRPATESERLHLVPRTSEISTTDLIARVLARER